jgi:opacity protein-like surface antigen
MVGSLFATSAFADEIAGETSAAKKVSVGAQIDLLPAGTLTLDAPGLNVSSDAGFAYGVGLNASYDLTPNISIGLAPRIIFNIVAKDARDDAPVGKEYDLRARVTAHFPLIDKLQIFGFAAPGYSFLTDTNDKTDNPSGFVLAFGGGATYDLAPNLFLTGEVGYQLGFQSVTAKDLSGKDITIDETTDYLSIGLGGGTRF